MAQLKAAWKYRGSAAWCLLALALILLQNQAVHNGELTLRVLHEQCVAGNSGIDLWNAQQERLARVELKSTTDTPQQIRDKVAVIKGLEFPHRSCE